MKPIKDTLGGMDKAKFLKQCATSFKFFGSNVLGLKVEDFHEQWANMFYSNNRSCVVAARGSGKSLITGCAFPLWLFTFDSVLRKNPQRFNDAVKLMVVCPTMKQSRKIIRDVKGYINRVELLHDILYPDLSWKGGVMWTADAIEMRNGSQMFAAPFTENMRSEHVNYILCDEAQDFKDLGIFDRALIPIASRWPGNICIIGTPKSEVDLIAKCRGSTQYYDDKKIVKTKYLGPTGYMVSEFPIYDRVTGNNIWPWRYTDKYLKQKKEELGVLGFAREYLCELVSDDAVAIDPEWLHDAYSPGRIHPEIRRFDTNLKMDGKPRLWTDKEDEEHREIPLRYMGTDLAESPRGDWSVTTVLEQLKPNSNYWILIYMDRRRGMGLKAHIDWLSKIHRSFAPIGHRIDPSQFGSGLIEALRVDHELACEGARFTPTNRMDMIISLLAALEGRRLIIPRSPNCGFTTKNTDELIHELSSLIPVKTPSGTPTYKTVSKHDDCVMSLCLATSQLRSQQSGRVFGVVR